MGKSNIRIRLAEPDDFPEIHKMILEFAEYEGQTKEDSYPMLTVDELIEDASSPAPWFFALVAVRENENKILGSAICNRAYCTWFGRSFYLEELFVKEEERGNGVASLLLGHLATICVKEGSKRLDWHLLRSNHKAAALYKRIGARDLLQSENRTAMRLDGPYIMKLAKEYLRN